MKPSTKYATIFAVVASLTTPAIFAQSAKSDDWYPTKSNTSVTWNASGSALYSSGKFKDTVDQFKLHMITQSFYSVVEKYHLVQTQQDVRLKETTLSIEL